MAILSDNVTSFKTGDLIVTGSVYAKMKTDTFFNAFIETCIARYMNRQFGDTSPEDMKLNADAIRSGEGRIFAYYKYFDGGRAHDIYIITEADRSYTTVLFCKEY